MSTMSNTGKERFTRLLPSLLFLTGVTILFLLLRYIPISLETIPYTYDQGRDFLAARNIIINKDITLIGPTTGAEGVFHGAWWYYFLTIPFVLFQGNPIGFYYFIALVGFIQAFLFWLYIKKEFNKPLAFLFLVLVAVSPYFIKTSVFAINSILTLPFILLSMFSLGMLMKKNQIRYLFLFTWSLGMIAEAEVAFGIFLFPSILLAIVLSGSFKLFFGSAKRVLAFFSGVTLAMILRIVFELKNNFLQTRALLSFFDAKGTQPKSFLGVFKDRLNLFSDYYNEIFPEQLHVLGWIMGLVALYGLITGYKHLEKHQQRFVRFLSLLIVSLFFISLSYRNSFFWEYYFEGIHYIFVTLILLGLYGLSKVYSEKVVQRLCIVGAIVIFVVGCKNVYSQTYNATEPENIGLRMHTQAVSYIYNEVGNSEFCLRMYTPPVLTHTYNYLLDHQALMNKGKYPRTVFINNECWYFIESDSYAERRENWLKNNIPAEAKKVDHHSISKDLEIEKWYFESK